MPKLRHVPRHERLACLPGPSRIAARPCAWPDGGAHDGHGQAFDPPQSLFLALAALAGLAVGGWLTLLTHRLPRMMEREWQAHCQEPAEPPPRSRRARRSMACAHRSRIVRNARRRSGAGTCCRWRAGCCSGCARARGAAIGWRYPAIELLTAVLFAACAWRFGPTPIALCGMGLSASPGGAGLDRPGEHAAARRHHLAAGLGRAAGQSGRFVSRRCRWRCWARWRATASCG